MSAESVASSNQTRPGPDAGARYTPRRPELSGLRPGVLAPKAQSLLARACAEYGNGYLLQPAIGLMCRHAPCQDATAQENPMRVPSRLVATFVDFIVAKTEAEPAATKQSFEAAWRGEPGGPDLSRL